MGHDDDSIGYARCSPISRTSPRRTHSKARGRVRTGSTLIMGWTGTNRSPPWSRPSPRAVRAGDTLVVPKLDRLARSVPDARTIATAL